MFVPNEILGSEDASSKNVHGMGLESFHILLPKSIKFLRRKHYAFATCGLQTLPETVDGILCPPFVPNVTFGRYDPTHFPDSVEVVSECNIDGSIH